jgi:hypothetical protein
MDKSAKKGAQLVEGREVKCFNAIAGGEGPCLYVLNRSLEFFRIQITQVFLQTAL